MIELITNNGEGVTVLVLMLVTAILLLRNRQLAADLRAEKESNDIYADMLVNSSDEQLLAQRDMLKQMMHGEELSAGDQIIAEYL